MYIGILLLCIYKIDIFTPSSLKSQSLGVEKFIDISLVDLKYFILIIYQIIIYFNISLSM